MTISHNVQEILRTIPAGVTLEAAAKTRSVEEVREAIGAGVTIIGENYLQESIPVIEALRDLARWHFIGTVQSNKVKDIVAYFDLVETVSSMKIASKIDSCALELERTIEVLIEVNSASEPQKGGVLPEDAIGLALEVGELSSVRLRGLMTMGPWTGEPEGARSSFAATKGIFETINGTLPPSKQMDMLSMGMSATYRVAIEEGATLVRIGEAIFGPRL
jgi:pyridoxal phosphate enzyme (YggS family)